MQKQPDEYRMALLDMDGTLYFQLPVRVFMALAMARYYVFRPKKWKELFVLRSYRRLRECRAFTEQENFIERQFMYLSKIYKMPVEVVCDLINNWMQQRPLKYIRRFRDKKLLSIINRLHENGAKIIIYSDYPVIDKAEAVGVPADNMFYAGDKIIGCMKPDPKGVFSILEQAGIAPNEVIFIGDRYEKDGLCAQYAGVDFILLKKGKIARKLTRYSGLDISY